MARVRIPAGAPFPMKSKVILVSTLILLTILALVYTKPSPPEALRELFLGQQQAFSPIHHSPECPIRHYKARIAWAYKGKPFNPNWLCLPGGLQFKYHDWDSDLNGNRKYPVVWSNREDLWQRFMDRVPSTYSGLILFANEPDRSDQANMTTQQTAELAIRIVNYAPQACLVGPMYSTADNGLKSRQAYNAYIALGGNPERLCYGSIHIYPRPGNDNNAQSRVDEYYTNYMIPTGQGSKKVLITEIGMTNLAYESEIFYDWLTWLNRDRRVLAYYIFSPYWPYSGSALGLFDWNTGRPTGIGQAARAAIGGWSSPQQGYP